MDLICCSMPVPFFIGFSHDYPSNPSPLIVYMTCPHTGMQMVRSIGQLCAFPRRGDVSPGHSISQAEFSQQLAWRSAAALCCP